ncbi:MULTISPECIES: SpoIVB peptidase [Clostridium]|uniref:SpoIVB peptidase n=2 Tax=Clostridium TaxID=1485 RepID=A0A151AQZ7_9CLOT|nr:MULTISPECIES: SpoIVB peptidase [Clostridium]MBE6078985.1 SpoIVB peptidase [Clostridium lundense]KYH29827.1 SpoIVB peptidase precursor [Clostridium colicanis DSM 13634]MBE6042714.1 SpoIVB peptidase [Clostridium thermopalmarium]PRR75208.1 SpoIVB peptidase precursor [Clostridium thermopalmarium DSM 5974]PVZ27964.1 stage IV sporulation protein B [Clostridium thermopalmarium DSM 5974]
MKNKKKCIICWSLIPTMILVMLLYFKTQSIPSTIFLREGQELKSNYIIKLNRTDFDIEKSKIYDEVVNVSLLGILPIKSVSVRSVPEIYVHPGGTPVGVKLNTKGVLVVALSDVEGIKGKIISPSAESGIQVGDIITKVNGVSINSSEELIKEINSSKNRELNIIIERNNNTLEKKVKPVKDKTDNVYKIGLWVRDSTSGVGTLTFYDSKSKKFAALGHPITDVDTGTVLKINKGEIVESSIISIRKGEKGNPGELRGIFINEEEDLGNVNKNTLCGIYGNGNEKLISSKYNKPIKIALRNEIKEGPAKILTTIDGSEPKLYDIKIEKLLHQDNPGPKSMVIKVIDEELLKKTGGIVQGMSGSPIIQDNKLVGAVTHVLINRPDVGYGIYIEWMLKDAGILAQ